MKKLIALLLAVVMVKTDTFAMPNEENFVGFANFVKGMTFGGYPFWKSAVYSLVITLLSAALMFDFHLYGGMVHFPC